MNLRKVCKIVLTCILILAMVSITILLTMKYKDEKTTLSIHYDQKNWIELPSFTFCSHNYHYNEPNMTFEEYMKQTSLVTDKMVTANFSIFTPHRQ